MKEFTREDIIEILKDETKNDWLFSLADEVRKKYVGDEIHLRALIEFSNISTLSKSLVAKVSSLFNIPFNARSVSGFLIVLLIFIKSLIASTNKSFLV